MPSFALVHSPLLGPATWSWVAGELRRRGHGVVVARLTDAAGAGAWEACVTAAVDAVPPDEAVVLVGHSGAGPLLPAIAARLPTPPALLLFVDATLPPVTGEAALVPAAFAQALRDLATDGVVPRWSKWFGPGVVDALVPNRERRAAVLGEQPEIPLAYFDGRVPVPAGWAASGCAYVVFSDPYRPEAAEAGARGWPVVEVPGSHLEPVVHPDKVADALVDLSAGL